MLVPDGLSLLGFAAARDAGGVGVDNWKCDMCKAPVKSPPTVYQNSVLTGREFPS